MSSVVAVETRPPRSAPRVALAAGGVVIAAALIWLIVSITNAPATVPRVTVVNDSPVDVDVSVAPRPGAGVLDLGPVDHGSSRPVYDVIDQGDDWVFSVDAPRGHVATFAVGREQLIRNGWTVHLPADLPTTRGGAAT
jgi:hypothetical protein